MTTGNLRRVLFLLSCLMLLLAVFGFAAFEQHACAGVPVMNERMYSVLPDYMYADLGAYLTQNGQPAALDRENSTIYISVNMKDLEHPSQLSAELKLHHLGYRLMFAPDDAFRDFSGAVSNGHTFSLLAVGSDHYMKYDVVFTTLPVLKMEAVNHPEPYGISQGSICLWDAGYLEQGYYSVAESEARWHRRGGSSRRYEKIPIKITLEEDHSDQPRNLDLLNLGSDDDWILNAMVCDDLKLREKVITTLWNEIQPGTSHGLDMSDCRYVEVIINGNYRGLYLLQRRIDNKYLGKGREQDIILKGTIDIDAPEGIRQAIAVKFNPSPLAEDAVLEMFTPFYHIIGQEISTIEDDFQLRFDEESWLDVNIFTSLFALSDNLSHKNMYYILHPEDTGYNLQFLLWDTDMSFGLGWENDGFVYVPEIQTTGLLSLRAEADSLFRQKLDLHAAFIKRYEKLRKGALSQEHIRETVLACHDEINRSGTLLRDQKRWGLRYEGRDTLTALMDFVEMRFSWLDQQYLPQ